MRYFFLALGLICAAGLGIFGLPGDKSRRSPFEMFPDMRRQAKLRPQTTSTFPGFSDGQSSRPYPAGTVAQRVGYADNVAWKDDAFNTGREAGVFVDASPVPVTAELIQRGRDRYGVYCQPCHGAQADGNGITKKLGMTTVANLQDQRIIKMADGEIFNTITYGKNTMMPYGGNVPVTDRWAIIAYLRALQLSHLGSADDVPAAIRQQLK